MLSNCTKEKQIELIEKNKDFFRKEFLDKHKEEEKLINYVKEITKEYGFLNIEVELEYHSKFNDRYEINFFFDQITRNIIYTIGRLLEKEKDIKKNNMLKEKNESFKIISAVMSADFGFFITEENEFYQLYFESYYIQSEFCKEYLLKKRFEIIKKQSTDKRILQLIKKVRLRSIYGEGYGGREADEMISLFLREELSKTKEFELYISEQIKEIVDKIKLKVVHIFSVENLINELMNGEKDILLDQNENFVKTILKEGLG